MVREEAVRQTRPLKIGLTGLMCTPFRGDKETQYADSANRLTGLAEELGFELHVVPGGMWTQEDAQRGAAELAEWGADLILLQTSSFGPGEFVYEFARLDAYLGIWAMPEGAPGPSGGLPLNSFTAANLYNSILKADRTGYDRPVKWFYGHPGDPLFDERLAVTVRALRAVVNLRGARIGLVGGVAPGFDNLIIDPDTLRQQLAVEVVEVEFDEARARAQGQPAEPVAQAAGAIRAGAARFDEEQAPALNKAGRVALTYQQLADELALDALAVSCWPRFQTDYHFTVCSVMGYLNDQGLIASCEGDVPSAAGMLALKYLSGDQVVTLMDLSAVDPGDESVLLWHCGPTAPSLADERGINMGSLWLLDGYEGPPIGLHNDLTLKPGAATVLGFTADFARLLVLDGVVDNQKAGYVGSRGWYRSLRLNGEPIAVPDLIETLMASGYQHHYPLAYGDLTGPALEMAAWLGMTPIEKVPYTPYLKG
jgi:L-fucose isomerase-like protein